MGRKTVCIILSVLFLGIVFGCKRTEVPKKPVEGVKHEVHWGYVGEGGPANWGTLKPEYVLCGSGMLQSILTKQ
jgi:carbonic anhydrase